MPTVAVVSFRLGLPDGVSVVAASWRQAFDELGYRTFTVAGTGTADRIVPGLAMDAIAPPTADEVDGALDEADIVVVENLLTFPANLPASKAVADALRGRPALLHHHDLPWQRAEHAQITDLPPDDPAWRHVVINRVTLTEMAERGIAATLIYNGFDVDRPPGDRAATRRRLGVADDQILLLHPVRAIARKNIPAALAMAEALDAVYWLTGPAEDGYAPILDGILAAARTTVRRDPMPPADNPQAYAACDAVLYPSTWEGFGMPPMEAALWRRPVVVGRYPVSDELRALGFHWFDVDDIDGLRAAIAHPDVAALDADRERARHHFSHDVMRAAIGAVVADAGWPLP